MRHDSPTDHPTATPVEPVPSLGHPLSRRSFLIGAGGLVGCGVGAKLLLRYQSGMHRAEVFIAKATSYDDPLETIIRDGLTELGLGPAAVKGKSVLLKPNLVEPSFDAPHINTHPKLVRAVAEVFRRSRAREVFVAEGQGHCRDSYLVLEQSGLGPMLDEAGLEFVDLNHDEVFTLPNRAGFSKLESLTLPTTLRRADLIVSLPKMKTHHWAGATLSMKNLFGVMPGIVYGWPKNVLHWAGIEQSIVDITATVAPHLAIVDGIIGMDGDGPIMGNPRHAGVLVMGTNLPAVDATAARLMDLNPEHIGYLAASDGWLGPIGEEAIEQRGEPIAELAQRFELLDLPMFNRLRG